MIATDVCQYFWIFNDFSVYGGIYEYRATKSDGVLFKLDVRRCILLIQKGFGFYSVWNLFKYTRFEFVSY